MIKFPAKLEFESVQAEVIKTVIDEGTKDPTMRVQVKWQHGGIINKNQRVYPMELLQREIDRLQEAVGQGEIYGASYHPVTGEAVVNDVSHIWNKIWMDTDGQCYGECTVLPTRTGKDAMVLIKHGRIGVSSRGAGTVTRKTKNVEGKKVSYEEVNKDFRLISPGDFVLSPSVPDARVRAVMEDGMSDIVTSYISENKHLFIETQDNKPEDSKSKIVEKEMDYENIEALKTDNEELFKSYEKGLKAETKAQIEKQILKVKTDLEASMKTAVEAVTKTNEAMIEGIRDAINVLTNVPGVIPEEVDKGADEKGKEEALEKQVADMKVKQVELQAKLDKRDTDEKTAKAKKEHQSELQKALNAEIEKPENAKFKSMLGEQFIVEDEVIGIENVEDVEEAVKTAKERISKIVAEGVKIKILDSGIEPKGRTEKSGDEPTAEETAKKDKLRFTEAISSGFKGTFEEYKAKVLLK